MNYPAFYKNCGTYTCIIDETRFMQVQVLKYVNRITYGTNKLMIEDVIKNDIQILPTDFAAVIVLVTKGVQELSEEITEAVQKRSKL